MKRFDTLFWFGVKAIIASFLVSTNVYLSMVSASIYAVSMMLIINSKQNRWTKLVFTIAPIILWFILVRFNIIDLRGL